MAIETDIYTPRTLGKLVRRLPPVRTFFLDTFFRTKKTFVTKSVEVDFKKGGRALAPFVHTDRKSKRLNSSHWHLTRLPST